MRLALVIWMAVAPTAGGACWPGCPGALNAISWLLIVRYSAAGTMAPRWPWLPPPLVDGTAMALAKTWVRSLETVGPVGLPWMGVSSGWGNGKGSVVVVVDSSRRCRVVANATGEVG